MHVVGPVRRGGGLREVRQRKAQFDERMRGIQDTIEDGWQLEVIRRVD